jgi:hypothetical protein
MTLADLWKYIKGDDILLVEPDGTRIPAYNNHKYMGRTVNTIRSLDNTTLVYLA